MRRQDDPVAGNLLSVDFDAARFVAEFHRLGMLEDLAAAFGCRVGDTRQVFDWVKLGDVGEANGGAADGWSRFYERRFEADLPSDFRVLTELPPLIAIAVERGVQKTGNAPEFAVNLFSTGNMLNRLDGGRARLPNESGC